MDTNNYAEVYKYMSLNLKISVQMSQDKSPLGNIEDRLIRLPKELRAKLGKDIGYFLQLKAKDGTLIPLQITHAYKNDAEVDPFSAYVSDDTYALLDITKKTAITPADDILLGCDPEFFIVDAQTNRNISASHFFNRHGEVGSDAGLAELRPRPHFTAEELTKCMHGLLSQAHRHLSTRTLYNKRPIRMVAASMHDNASAGFHIHFGLPAQLLNKSSISYTALLNMVYVLDYYVGISSVLPEGNEDCMRRSKRYSQYGKPGDFRDDNRITMEYRVPGGHLLRHPVLTAGLLALCDTVMKDMLSRMRVYTNNFTKADVLKKYEDLKDMYPTIPDRNTVYNTITDESIRPAITHSDSIVDDVSKMIGFNKNKKQIMDYFNYVVGYLSNGNKYTDNIAHNWRLMHHEG